MKLSPCLTPPCCWAMRAPQLLWLKLAVLASRLGPTAQLRLRPGSIASILSSLRYTATGSWPTFVLQHLGKKRSSDDSPILSCHLVLEHFRTAFAFMFLDWLNKAFGGFALGAAHFIVLCGRHLLFTSFGASRGPGTPMNCTF